MLVVKDKKEPIKPHPYDAYNDGKCMQVTQKLQCALLSAVLRSTGECGVHRKESNQGFTFRTQCL